MYYKRNLENHINKNINNDDVLLVLGARQTGKTTLLKKIFRDLSKKIPVSLLI